MTTAPATKDLETEVFEFVRHIETSVLDTGRKWADAFGDAIPVELPFVRHVVRSAFDFSEDVLKAERDFAQDMVKRTRALAPPADRAAHKTPAHRSPAKKTTPTSS